MSFSSDDSELEAAAAAKARAEAQKEAPPPAPVEMSPEFKQKVESLEAEMKIAEANVELLISTQGEKVAEAENAITAAQEDLESPKDLWTHKLTGKRIGDPKDDKLKKDFETARRAKEKAVKEAKRQLVALEKDQTAALKEADKNLHKLKKGIHKTLYAAGPLFCIAALENELREVRISPSRIRVAGGFLSRLECQ